MVISHKGREVVILYILEHVRMNNMSQAFIVER